MEKFLFTLIFIAFLTSCGSDNERIRAEQERNALQKQLEEVKFGATNLLSDAKKFADAGDIPSAKSKLNELVSRHSDRPEAAEAKVLINILDE